jgi:hypothetical protein
MPEDEEKVVDGEPSEAELQDLEEAAVAPPQVSDEPEEEATDAPEEVATA